MGRVQRIIEFTISTYLAAFLLDYVFYKYGFTVRFPETTTSVLVAIWGFVRMWSVTLVVLTCLLLHRVNVKSWFKRTMGFTKRALLFYLLSPLLVYFTLGVYVLIAYPLGLFDFNAYVEVIAEYLKRAVSSQVANIENLAQMVAITQLFQAYIAAITINTLFALGEEIGWRAYLFELFDYKPGLKSTVLIGVCWGLWHASAILLLGYNYTYNRLLGVLLFTLLTIALTYPHLVFTSRTKSVIPASSLHGAVNAIWPLTLLATRLPVEQREILLGLGVLGIVAWTITSTIIIATFKYLSK
ncbi:MAG: CPBP family intramembrane metalloprotease [Desulfurococcaceae archaeon]|nr:CPBP family intramembrane metalloprotease [Desulfurococcaceae archaeon]